MRMDAPAPPLPPTGFRGSMFLFSKNLKQSELRVLFYSNSLMCSKIENTVKESQAFHKKSLQSLKRGFGMRTRHLPLTNTSVASSFGGFVGHVVFCNTVISCGVLHVFLLYQKLISDA